MILPRKLATASRLLTGGEFHNLLVRLRYNLRMSRIARHDGKPFFYKNAGTRFWCDPGVYDSRNAFTGGAVDLLERGILRRWLKPGDVVIDGGANMGAYSYDAAEAVGATGLVVAVEPTPALAKHILSAAAHLGHRRLRVAQVALSNKTGRAAFAFAPPNFTASNQSLAGTIPPENTAEVVDTEITTLDALLHSHLETRQPAAIKLDIEGAELLALQAAPPAWLERDGPLWLVECNEDGLNRFEATVPGLIAAFPDAEFEKWIIPKYHSDEGNDPPQPAIEPLPPAPYYNLVAIPRGDRWKGRRDSVRLLLDKNNKGR